MAQTGQKVIWHERLFDNTAGLLGGHVYQVFEDNNGFLWLVTETSLQFFDGNHFYPVYDHFSVSAYDKVRILCQDKTGRIWVRYEENGNLRVRVFDGQSRVQLSLKDYLPEGLVAEQINGATSRTNGDLLILTRSGDLWLQSGATGLWTEVASCVSPDFDFVASKQHDGIWLVSQILPEEVYRTLGYWSVGDTTLRYFHIPDLIHVNRYRGEKLILVTKTQLVFLQPDGHAEWHAIGKYFPNVDPDSPPIREFNSEFGYNPTNGDAFLIYKNYLELSNIDTQKAYHLHNKLFLKTYFSVGFGSGKNIWVGTLEGFQQFTYGNLLFEQIMWLNPSENQFAYQNSVRGIASCNNGKLLFSAKESIHEYDPETGAVRKLFTTGNGTSDVIWDESNQRIWTLGDYLFEYDPLQDKLTRHEKPDHFSDGITFGLYSLGDSVLVSSTNGMLVFRVKEGKFVPFDGYGEFGNLATAEIYGYFDYSEKELLIYTNKGVFVWEKGGQVTGLYSAWSTGKYYLPTLNVRHIHRDTAGVLWLATAEGLIRWEPGSHEIRRFTTADGLYDQNLYGVFEDEYGFLWLSTNNGIIQFHKESGLTKHYSEADGISNNEFNRVSHEQDRLGHIYFGGLNGITRFHPDRFLFEPLSLKDRHVQLIELSVFSKKKRAYVSKMTEYFRDNHIQVHPTELNLEATFAVSDFDVGGEVSYAYRLNRRDSDVWIPLPSSNLQIPSLPYGNYNLEIRVRDKELEFGDSYLVIPLEVIPPLHLRKWFIALMVFLFFALSILIVAREFRRRESQNRLLQKMVAESIETIAADKKLIEDQAVRLEQKNQEKDRFFANVSHEFRTPISLILGSTELLEKKFKPSSRESGVLQTLKNNAEGLLKLINDILMLSKLDHSPLLPKADLIELKGFLTGICAEFDGSMERKNITFIKTFPNEEEIWIKFDQQFLKIILQNLLSNALKFTPVNGEVFLGVIVAETYITIKVQDNGRGIHPVDLPHIFERYYQSARYDAPVEGGTGIGLSLVRELVNKVGGEVEVSSIWKQGTTFTIQVPFQAAFRPYPQEPGQSHAVSLGKDLRKILPKKLVPLLQGRHLLLVEDNPDFYDYIKQILGDFFDLKYAGSGAEAMIQLRNGLQPVLIITDLMMPEMDGLQLVAELKSSVEFKNIPVIALTARADDQCRIDAFSLGVNDYLLKPFDSGQLISIIAHLLERGFEREVFADVEEQTSTNEDELAEWLMNLKAEIEQGMTSPDFTVEKLAIQLFMSRTAFYNKVKSVVGMTPNQLVMEIRLQKARAYFISDPKLTNKQVMKMIGLKHEPHFIQIFTRRFGYRPGQMKI